MRTGRNCGAEQMEPKNDGKESSNTALWVLLGVIIIAMTLTFIVQMYSE
jgi:hypothetical protein